MEESKPVPKHVMFRVYDLRTLWGIVDTEPRDMVVEQMKREMAYQKVFDLIEDFYEYSPSSSSEDEEEESTKVCHRPQSNPCKTQRRGDPPPRVSRRYSQHVYLHRFTSAIDFCQSRKQSLSRRQR